MERAGHACMEGFRNVLAQGMIIASDPGGRGLGPTDGPGGMASFSGVVHTREGAQAQRVPAGLGASSADWTPGVWLTSLRVMSSKFIHVVPCGRVFSFKAEEIFHCSSLP